MSFNVNVRQNFVECIHAVYDAGVNVLSVQQIKYACELYGVTYPAWFAKPKYSTGARGMYSFRSMVDELELYKSGVPEHEIQARFPTTQKSDPVLRQIHTKTSTADNVVELPQMPVTTIAPEPTPEPTPEPEATVSELIAKRNYVPELDSSYIGFGYASKMKKILDSKIFLPMFVAGLSGNGKTFIAEQICAKLGREFINVPITIETTEDDLLGGFRLVNGQTVWSNGPVVEAMERGAILLLDEVDLASHKIMCLQSVIDGKGVYLKKIGQYVRPEPGFNIIATANTKGKGKWKGQFVGTNILNEAFLERFGVLFEQEYPSPIIERRILAANIKRYGFDPKEDKTRIFIALLIEWANQIRRQFNEGNLSEVISTRRLIHIIKYYSIFEDKLESVREGTNRFSDDNKEAFTELYAGIDGDPDLIAGLIGNAPSDDGDESDAPEMVSVNI